MLLLIVPLIQIIISYIGVNIVITLLNKRGDYLNIREYLVNPLGKGSSVLMIKDTQRVLDSKYHEVKGRIRMKWYTLYDKYYIAHLKIPSMTHDKLSYDVLLEFDIDSIRDSANVINDGNVRVFSNCPSFTYTYANVFDKNRDMIDWAKSKYSSEIFTKEPETRNPYKLRSYERSLYFAIKYVLSDGRNYVRSLKAASTKVEHHRKILVNIRSNSEIEELYRRYSNEKRKRELQDKRNQAVKEKKPIQKNATTRKDKTGVVGKTKTTSKVKSTKKTRKTKKF